MSEYRQDRISGAWVIVAPERGHRPHAWSPDGFPKAAKPYDPACPFCPGNEHMLPGIVDETPGNDGRAWKTRVIPNKYPALRAETGVIPVASNDTVLAGYGLHEVIIESPRHDADLATLAESELTAILHTYRQRHDALAGRPGINAVILFRNHGREAGASLVHPHTQIIASAIVPPRLATISARARAFHERDGHCITCREIELELEDDRRVVEVTGRFAVIVPLAAVGPYEQWILPRQHQASFGHLDDEGLEEFGRTLQRCLSRLRKVLGNRPYNFAVDTFLSGDHDTPFLHWGLRILPSLVKRGGFELAGDMPINPSRPEDDAVMLRAASPTTPAGTG